ncbi:CRISPR-associated protein Cas4 [Methanosarcina sp.]|uniref:CRISPR-associated protein Cas4 n=1 Tax=Methanosarcina sp. TaxID=2213 RepID=UPI003BB7F60D
MLRDDELVNVSDVNQFLYCPRRYYYISYFDTIEMNYFLRDGQIKHRNQSRRGGWVREFYVQSERLGIHGKIDVLEVKKIKDEGYSFVPIERKRASSYYENDEIQLATYCMLLEEYLDEPVGMGYIYLFGTNERYAITITERHRQKVLDTITAIQNIKLDAIPDFAENLNKCKKCSVIQYCMPFETKILEKIR